MASYHYSMPHPGYPVYDYSSSSSSPAPEYDYYHPEMYRTTPTSARPTSKRQHVRTTSYTTPRVAAYTIPAGFAYTSPDYQRPSKHEHVSTRDSHVKPRARGFTASGGGGSGYAYPESGNVPKRHASIRSQNQRIFVDAADDADDRYAPEPVYAYIAPRTTALPKQKKTAQKADTYFFYNQTTTAYEIPDTPVRSRARRSSTATGQRPKIVSSPPKSARAVKPPPEATAADAVQHHIPAGYSLKNWDPTESPILLLGSVFDANSLGKWIYDWTVYHHKAGSPLTEVAGELWLLLIKFAGKMKRAEECLPRIRGRDNRELVRDFHASGERIWGKLKDLLKRCEEYMWKAAKSGNTKGKVQMGEKSGIEFVKSIFGRDRQLDRTEKLMQNMRMWNMEFDADCEDILRRPTRD